MCGVTNEPAHPSQHIYWIKKGGERDLRGRYPATTVNTITNKGKKGPLGVGDPATTVNTITNKEKRGLRGGRYPAT